MQSRFDNYRFANRWIRFNRWIQVCLFCALVVGLNFLAARHAVRVDFSAQKKHSLSAESLGYLSQLEAPVSIVVAISSDGSEDGLKDIYNDIYYSLREYDYAGYVNGQKKIFLEYVNPYRQTKRTRELVGNYGIEENAIVVSCEGYTDIILPADLYEVQDSGETLFKGEEAITAAIVKVSKKKKNKIYFIQGHGEMQLNDPHPISGLSELSHFLEKRNFELISINLTSLGQIPEDADIVIVASPQVGFVGAEEEALSNYLKQDNGRLVLFLDPGRTHNLDDLLFNWGILSDEASVVDVHENARSISGDLIVRRFASHPITDFLTSYQLTVMTGPMRPVRPDLGAAQHNQIEVLPLMASSDESWAQRGSSDEGFDADRDIPGPISLGVVAEYAAAQSDFGLKIPRGKLIVFGNSDMIGNNHFRFLGNKMLFLNTIDWCLGSEKLLHIFPNTSELYSATLSKQESMKLAGLLAVLPVICLMCALGVWWVRRK